jgi:hypothetical protein
VAEFRGGRDGGRQTADLWLEQNRHRKRWQRGLDGNDHETVDWMAKRKGIDETNAMVCSPSAKDERHRWKSSPELRRSRRSWGRRQSRRRIRMTEHITVQSSTRETPGWCPSAPEVHGFAGKARWKFVRI